jgi:hypothetical protein
MPSSSTHQKFSSTLAASFSTGSDGNYKGDRNYQNQDQRQPQSSDLFRDLAATAKLLQAKGTLSMICVMILRSGRFAAAIFEGTIPLMHKVLRRYTIRAKAGGSQSSHDSQGKKAKSAGAMLRRYGEYTAFEHSVV